MLPEYHFPPWPSDLQDPTEGRNMTCFDRLRLAPRVMQWVELEGVARDVAKKFGLRCNMGYDGCVNFNSAAAAPHVAHFIGTSENDWKIDKRILKKLKEEFMRATRNLKINRVEVELVDQRTGPLRAGWYDGVVVYFYF